MLLEHRASLSFSTRFPALIGGRLGRGQQMEDEIRALDQGSRALTKACARRSAQGSSCTDLDEIIEAAGLLEGTTADKPNNQGACSLLKG